MAVIPVDVVNPDLERLVSQHGWQLHNRGKVRDTYKRMDHPDSLHVVATDRVSIFDFVLNALVPGKGEILTALTHFWLADVLKNVPNHLFHVSPHFSFPPRRTLVVQALKMQSYEFIFRMHLGGSVWKQYQETGIVAGHRLPEGMQKWQKLPTPLFTPSTKALVGHDVNITAQTYLDAWPIIGQRNVAALAGAYTKAYKYTEERGILILDSKFEIGHPFSLADEVLTPDSSRFTTVTDWQQAIAEGRDPFFFDKQYVREWGAHIQTPFGVTGIGKLDPENDEHLAFVHSLVVPAEVISETSRRYHKLFEMIVGMPLEQYQREVMQIA